nr:hypothetical protein [Tanacetum cinerariifolium]
NKVLTKPIGLSEQTYEPTTAKEKQDRRNEMKARGTLLMALPNKDQLKFHSYQDAKLLMEAIEKRYEGNKESKKLQKLNSQLELQGEVLQQEDINLKLLRSLPSEWKTYALTWRNKAELETISMDDLYNNLKIYEPEISGSSNTDQNLQNMAFVSSNSTSSTNKADATASGFSTAHTQGTIVNATTIDSLSDAMICSFLEMDLHWEMAILTIRARRFMKRTRRSLDMNGQRISFHKTKVECFNCHKNGYFARECRAPRNQDNRGREYGRTPIPVETPTENALIAQDEIKGMIGAIKLRKRILQTMHSWLLHLQEVLLVLILSQVSDKSKAGLGYKEQIPESFVNSSELLEKQNNRSTKGYHEVPPPLTGNYMPPKTDLRLIDEHLESESVDVSSVSSSADKTVKTVDITHKDDDNEDELSPKVEVITVKPSVEKIESVKTARETGNPQQKEYKEKGVIDSGCSRNMTGNKCYLTDFKAFDGGFVSFGDGKVRISGKGKIKTGKLDFDDVYFSKELNVDLKSVVSTGDLTCLFAKATLDESNIWHRRLGHINFKTMNKIVKGNLVRGLPSKIFQNDNSCVACQKGKQQKALSDKGTEFKNSVMTQFFDDKGIKREYSVARTPQQHKVVKRRNRTLIEAARTIPPLDFMKPFRCPVTIINTRENLGKFEGKANEGYFVGYLVDSVEDARKKAPEVDAGEALDNGGQDNQVSRSKDGSLFQQDRQTEQNNSTNDINTVSLPVSTARPSFVNAASQIPLNVAGPSACTNAFEEHSFARFSLFNNAFSLPHVSMVTPMNDTEIFGNAYNDVLEEEVDMNNVDSSYAIPEATKFLKDHPQEQLLDYGFNLMNTKIYIDNESTICIVKSLVFHSKTKHIEPRHHFIRDTYEKKLIQQKDARCLVDTSEVTTGNTLLSTAGLTTAEQRLVLPD